MHGAVSCCPTELKSRANTVLVVEDERVSRRALSLLLNSCGYVAQSVESGEEALERVAENGIPGIALVDVDLPGMTGLELVSRLERMSPDVHVIIVSATDGDRIHRFCREHDHVTFLRKPLDFDRLLSAIADARTQH